MIGMMTGMMSLPIPIPIETDEVWNKEWPNGGQELVYVDQHSL